MYFLALASGFDGTLSEGGKINSTIMVVPAGVNKATGLTVALDDRGISPEAVVSVGDGENDTILFEFTGCGVAVANADAVVKAKADEITGRPVGAGVGELINRLTMVETVQIWRCQATARVRVRMGL